MTTRKLELLKEYIHAQEMDHGLWWQTETVAEGIMQEELRRVAWLIEEATDEQIQNEIIRKKGEL